MRASTCLGQFLITTVSGREVLLDEDDVESGCEEMRYLLRNWDRVSEVEHLHASASWVEIFKLLYKWGHDNHDEGGDYVALVYSARWYTRTFAGNDDHCQECVPYILRGLKAGLSPTDVGRMIEGPSLNQNRWRRRFFGELFGEKK